MVFSAIEENILKAHRLREVFLSLPVAESLASQVSQTSSPEGYVTWKT